MMPSAPHRNPGETGLTRRRFLEGLTSASGALVAPMLVPASVRGNAATPPPSERIAVAVIGHGLMGRGHLRVCLGRPDLHVLAVCDPDRSRCQEARQRVQAAYQKTGTATDCLACTDYREILARPDIDAVLIATPDHWHAPIAAQAACAGKDVYCEKPVSLTIAEGRRLAEVVRNHATVFQTGTQYRSMPTTRRVCEFVRSGGLGPIRHAFALWSRCEGAFTPVNPHLEPEPVPEGLDWDLWVGPAPWHDYNRRYHRNPPPGVVPWAFCEDFGAASVTWHHSHSADVIQYALGYESGGPVEILHPDDAPYPSLTYRYSNGTLLHLVEGWNAVKTQYGILPDKATIAGSFGGLFVGERGWVTALYGGGPVQGEPEGIFQEMGLRNRTVTGANNHHANWIECIRSRGRTSTGAEIGHRAASLGHLAHIAFKLGRSLRWDPDAETFADDPEANRLRMRAMREPWRM